MAVIVTEQRLEDILAAYGASPARWPEAERDAALQALEQFPRLQEIFAAEAELDRLLDTAPAAPVSDALIARLLAARPNPAMRFGEPLNLKSIWRSIGQAIWPDRPLFFPVGAFAASAALGVLVVMASPSTFSTLVSPVFLEENIVADAASEQLVALAFAEIEYPEEWKSYE